MSVTKCNYKSYYECELLKQVVKITPETTTDEFDLMHAAYVEKQGKHVTSDMFLKQDGEGCTVLHQAAKSGNTSLIKHIVNLKGQNLLSLGNGYGWTSLSCAVKYRQSEAVETLLALGAPVNITTSVAVRAPDMNLPVSTSLWYAAQVTRDVGVCKILLMHGAVAFPSLDVEGEKILKQADQQLKADEVVQTAGLMHLTPMAITTIQIVKDYLGHRK